jgi:hypothetical protein
MGSIGPLLGRLMRRVVSEALEFFLESKLLALHGRNLQLVMTRMGHFVSNRLFQPAVFVRKVLDVRLKSHWTSLLLLPQMTE